jgi:hypothetical protein
MGRIAAVGLALFLAGCGTAPDATRGEQVPLLTEEVPEGGLLLRAVIDVDADPESGTPIIEVHGVPVRWRNGFTAWRIGSETEVLDPEGNRVLITGQKYLFRPAETYRGYWVIGHVEPCPPGRSEPRWMSCELGVFLE